MERRVKEYLTYNEYIEPPYENHYGNGCSMGYYDVKGCGRAYVSYEPTDNNYTGKDIISVNGNRLHMVNGYLLYITNIHEPWANAEIIKNDLTTQKCYIGKVNDNYVISDTLHDALIKLREAISTTDDNERDTAKAFVIAHPCYDKEYDWEEMIAWHSMVKTSCAEGRRSFSDYSNKTYGAKATPREVIGFMKAFGMNRIAKYTEDYYLNKRELT